jgi:tellurite resistance protein TerC
MNTLILKTLQQAKRLIVIVVGSTILLIGIAMLVLPGPAVLVIPIGLGVLATELVWARRLLTKLKSTFQKRKENASRGRTHGID